MVDLKARTGKQNMGGLINKAHLIPLADLDLTTPLALSAVGKLDFTTTLKALPGKRFYVLYSTPEKIYLNSNSVGERDGKSKENLVELFYPGNEQECAEFEAYILNTPVVIVVRDPKGNRRVLGLCRLNETSTEITEDITCNLEVANSVSGSAYAELAGTTFQWKSASPHSPLYYKGTAVTNAETPSGES